MTSCWGSTGFRLGSIGRRPRQSEVPDERPPDRPQRVGNPPAACPLRAAVGAGVARLLAGTCDIVRVLDPRPVRAAVAAAGPRPWRPAVGAGGRFFARP